MSSTTIEIIGYAASLLVAVSLSMSNIVRLRWINLVGAVTFTAYGLLVGAMPVAVVNAYIAVINVRFLMRHARSREAFDLLDPSEAGGMYRRFLQTYGDDAATFYPSVGWPLSDGGRPEGAVASIVLRDLSAAGLIVWRRDGARIELLIDYAAPPFRDHKSARYVYERLAAEWREAGAERVVCAAQHPSIRRMLTKAGFTPDGDALSLSLS